MKVNETRRRSLLKAISFRVFEVAFEAWVISYFVTVAIAVGIAVLLETTCFILHFIFERVWNKIPYGREVK